VTVHDEINFSAAEVEDVDAVLREVMESVEFDVPMLTERKVGATWGTLEKK
jgi:DNA polymerase I-like protein with 3'-5' exonuclease and polymerase domains